MTPNPRIRGALEGGDLRECGDTLPPEPVLQLYEALIGIGTAARACEHLLRRGEPDVAELRGMMVTMIAASNTAIAIVRN